MLLVCPRCQNQYTLDDQTYAQQGALCSTCMEPLVPAQNDGYNQWGGDQSQYDGQWGNQPQGDAQWGNNDAQWGNQPQGDAQWGNQPQGDAQWGNQPQGDAQWGNQQGDAQWGSNDAQWGNQPQGSDIQWGNQPSWQGDDVPTGMGTGPTSEQPNYGGSERTVALDLDLESLDGPGDLPASTPASAPAASGSGKANLCIVGSPLPNNDNATGEIDLAEVNELYGDEGGGVSFFQSLSKTAIIGAVAVVVVAIIVFAIVAVQISKPEAPAPKLDADGNVIEEGADTELSFKDIVSKTKEAIPSFPMIEGTKASDGVLIGASEDAGILYNSKKIADYAELQGSNPFHEKLYQAAMDDKASSGKPIILIVDSSMSMKALYHLMYTFGATRRKVLIGGITGAGVSTVEVFAGDWPDHGSYIYLMDAPPNTELTVSKSEIVLRRTTSEDSLVTDEGDAVKELKDDVHGGKIVLNNIKPALAKFKASKQPSLLIAPDEDVTVNTFLNIVEQFKGDEFSPNVGKIMLDQVPRK